MARGIEGLARKIQDEWTNGASVTVEDAAEIHALGRPHPFASGSERGAAGRRW